VSWYSSTRIRLEAALVMFARFGVLLQQPEPEREQIVEIHCVGRTLAFDIALAKVGNLRGELLEVTELRFKHFGDRRVRIGCERKNFMSTSGFGKCVPFVSMPASAMQDLIKSFASSRSRMVKSRR